MIHAALRPLLLLPLSLLLVACEQPADGESGSGSTSILANGSFESETMDPWYTAVHANPESFEINLDPSHAHEGSQSIRIHSLGMEPWGGVLQLSDNPAEGDSRWRLQAWFRGADITDGPELMVVFRGNRFLNPISHRVEDLSGDFGWSQRELEFDAPAGVRRIEIGLIHHGLGTLWVDAASLSQIEP